MLKRFVILIACMLPFIGMGDVLLWEVTESTKVDGGNIQQFLVPYPTTDDAWPAARVKLVSSDGTSSTILKIYWGSGYEEDGDWGVELSDPGNGYWGAGNPVGMQSATGYDTIGTIQGQLNGDVMSYPPEILEALFIMELGYNEWNDSVGDYVWRTLASSNPETYEALRSQYMYAAFDISPSGATAWNPDFYTMNSPIIPEPSSALLLLIGASILCLKRQFYDIV